MTILNTIFDIIAIIFSTFFLSKSVRQIFKGSVNIIYYCIIVFYFVQVIPLILKVLLGMPDDIAMHSNLYKAVNDELTCIIYSIFVVISLLLLSNIAKKIDKIGGKKTFQYCAIKLPGSIHVMADFLLSVVIGIPLIVVLAAPKPEIYTHFSYFYTHAYINTSEEFIFHQNVLKNILMISTIAIWLKYLIRRNEKQNIYIYIMIFVNTWLDGKRTLFTFALLGILAIDVIRGEFNKKKMRQFMKACLFLVMVVGYFLLYKQITGKSSTMSLYYQYSVYISRMTIVELAIYDKIYEHRMLDYPLQTIIFALFVWIPRRYWPNKPVMYTKYFTRFANNSLEFVPSNLMVNIWAEMISNVWILGPIITCLILFYIARICVKSKSGLLRLLGTVFCVLYSMYGFEHIVIILFYLWVGTALIEKIKTHIKFIKRYRYEELTGLCKGDLRLQRKC